MKKSIVYQTINLVNNKIYIGVHMQENPHIFDGYLGCGFFINHKYYLDNPQVPIHYAIKKYGIKNFKRITLAVFDSYEEALKLEAELVNEEFIKRSDTYNVSLGGRGGNFLFPINQFDLNGNLIYTWDNMILASEALGVSHTSINTAKLYKGSCLGYYWSTDSSINIKEYSLHKGTKTYQYSASGKFIQVFNSVTEAAKAINSEEKTIYRAIKSEIKHKDYYWSFKCCEEFVPKKIPNLKGKILYIYDLQGNYLTELKAGKEVYNYYKTKSYGNLKQAILNNRPFKNTQISLIKVDKMPKATCFKLNSSKKIGVYNQQQELIETFNSIKATVSKYGSSVNRVLRGQQKQTKGLIFKYLD